MREAKHVERYEKLARTALLRCEGVGPRYIKALLEEFGSASAIRRAGHRARRQVGGIGPVREKALSDVFRSCRSTAEIDVADRKGYRLLGLCDADYPTLLREIYDPPPFFWLAGNAGILNNPSVAIVGTRRPSDAGRILAHDLAFKLAANGISIVSGLAYGIDRCAHDGALEAGGYTVAVLGSGLEDIYPARHRALANRIFEQGAIVSEFPLFMSPLPGHFPRRNRIISGLAHATIIVEAYRDGGALITGRFALDQNRDVFAVPGPPGSRTAEGTNRLIQRGEAQLLLSASEVLRSLEERRLLAVGECRGKNLSKNMMTESDCDITNSKPSIPKEYQTIFRLVSTIPIHLSELSDVAGIDTPELLVALLHMECAGHVRQLPGKYFVSGLSGS